MNAATNDSSIHKKIFTLAIVVYPVLLAIVFIFVSRVFGPVAAGIMSLILLFPLILAISIRIRWPAVKSREFVYLVTLLIVSICFFTGFIYTCHHRGMDRQYAEYVKYNAFIRLIENDPAFYSIEMREGKSDYWIQGTVDSGADLDRLKSLTIQSKLLNEDDLSRVTVGH